MNYKSFKKERSYFTNKTYCYEINKIEDLDIDDNIDFRMLHGDAYDYDVSSDLFRLSDDLHGVDIKRVIMKLKQYMQSDEYSTLDSDLKDQVKNTIASLQSEYDEKMSEIFGEQ